ncbi:MAG: hypothetical protein R2749_11955 [Acidimicrobiales bacterium]
MNAIVLAVCGAGVGAGLLIIIRALQPRAIPLQRLALILDRPGVAVAQLTVEPEGHAGVRGAQRHLSAIGLAVMRVVGAAERPKLVDQLRVLDKPLERHAYEKTSPEPPDRCSRCSRSLRSTPPGRRRSSGLSLRRRLAQPGSSTS